MFGVGAMNSIATRFMLEKGVQIVGAISRSPAKVGRDLGEVAGLDHPIGVKIERDARHVLIVLIVHVVKVIAAQMQDLNRSLQGF